MDYKILQKFSILVLIATMRPTHRYVRKAVSLIVTLLLIFTLSPFCSCAATISETFTYDANGNMISGSGFIFVYNDANQLVNVINESDSSTVAEYFYDANGQRVKKIEGSVTTYYIGDYVETRVTGSTADNTSYYFANNERVARKDPDGAMFYYHGDHLGSTSIVTDETGAQSEKVSYYPYGSVKERVGEGSTYLYTDQEFDEESGLYYYGARYYDSELTRFIQPDTITQDIYNPQNLNRYSYVLNNPLKYTDPTGNVRIEGVIENVVLITESLVGMLLGVPGDPGSSIASVGVNLALIPVELTTDPENPAQVERVDKMKVCAKVGTDPRGVATLLFLGFASGFGLIDIDRQEAVYAASDVIDETNEIIVAGPYAHLVISKKALDTAIKHQEQSQSDIQPVNEPPEPVDHTTITPTTITQVTTTTTTTLPIDEEEFS